MKIDIQIDKKDLYALTQCMGDSFYKKVSYVIAYIYIIFFFFLVNYITLFDFNDFSKYLFWLLYFLFLLFGSKTLALFFYKNLIKNEKKRIFNSSKDVTQTFFELTKSFIKEKRITKVLKNDEYFFLIQSYVKGLVIPYKRVGLDPYRDREYLKRIFFKY